MLTADVIIQIGDNIILIGRKHEPFQDHWALPGGKVDEGETTLEAAFREVKEETNLDLKNVFQFASYDEPGRDPRGRFCTTVYEAEAILTDESQPEAGDDAKSLVIVSPWWAVDNLELAFDHEQIILDWLEYSQITR